MRYDAQTVGQRILTLRRHKGWAQRELAVQGALSHGTVSQIERGQRVRPSTQTLEAIASALGWPSADVMLSTDALDPAAPVPDPPPVASPPESVMTAREAAAREGLLLRALPVYRTHTPGFTAVIERHPQVELMSMLEPDGFGVEITRDPAVGDRMSGFPIDDGLRLRPGLICWVAPKQLPNIKGGSGELVAVRLTMPPPRSTNAPPADADHGLAEDERRNATGLPPQAAFEAAAIEAVALVPRRRLVLRMYGGTPDAPVLFVWPPGGSPQEAKHQQHELLGPVVGFAYYGSR